MDTWDRERAYAIAEEVVDELVAANRVHGPMNSHHEAYAVIKEELDEYWAEVLKKKDLRSNADMRKELIQIAAMAIKTIVSLIPEKEDDGG